MRLSSRVLLCFVVLALVTRVERAPAQLLAYDGFEYSAGTQLWGTIPGNGDGGFGWGSTWSATSAALATNSSPGLSYSTLPQLGGSVVMGNPLGSTATSASSQRLLPNTLSGLVGGTGSIWISFLYQNWSTDTGGLLGFREAKLALFSGSTLNANGSANVNGSERLDVGTPNTYAAGASDTLTLWQGSTYSSSGIATPRGANPANTVFVLLRLDVDNTTAADTAYAWFNQGFSSEPSTGTAVSFLANDLSAINALRFQAGNLNGSGTNAVFVGDELHVGLTWNDVVIVPEPTVVSLIALAGIGLAAACRRRKA